MSGWKTYACVAAAVVVLGLKGAGQAGLIPLLASVPQEVWDFALYILGFGSVAALRAAVAGAAATPFASLPKSSEPELWK